jgi:formate transporter
MINQNTENNTDTLSPVEIARKVETVGVTKAHLDFVPMIMLSVLAGAFVALGAAFYTLVMTENGIGFGPSRLLGGMAFSTGLILVFVGGLSCSQATILLSWRGPAAR